MPSVTLCDKYIAEIGLQSRMQPRVVYSNIRITSYNVCYTKLLREQLRRRFILARLPAFLAEGFLHFRQFFLEQLAEQLDRYFATVVEHTLRRANPLPYLRARDFGRRRILHRIEHRHAAIAGEPGAEVLNPDADVVAQAGLGDRRCRIDIQQVCCVV